jgi:hypothetical protein
MLRLKSSVCGAAALIALSFACGRQNASPVSPGTSGAAPGPAAPDGSTLKVSAPVPTSPINDQVLSDFPTLTATGAAPKFGPAPAGVTYRFQVFNDAGAQVVDSGQQGGPSYRVTGVLEFKKRHTWRVRAELADTFGPWSAVASFISSEGGYIRGNEVFDPLYNGVTVGEIHGPVTFLPNQGIKLETNQSFVKYTIPVTITAGEFSMEVMGLRPNNSGDKSKVFAMASGAPDFITDPYRADIQYRGTGGVPPNSITYRVLFGSATDLDVRYEPTTTQRLSAVYNLDPNATYYWKFTWGNGKVRLTVQNGRAKDNGQVFYDVARNATNGAYNPQPHIAYIGAPTGRSGAEAASIPGSIFRNVWIGARPRP